MSDFVKQKSFELSYALFQLARLVKQRDLRERIEANAVSLLEASEHNNVSLLGQSVAVLRKLVILCEGIGEVSYEHSRVINRQFSHLNSAIAEYVSNRQRNEEKSMAIDIERLFHEGISEKLPASAPNNGGSKKDTSVASVQSGKKTYASQKRDILPEANSGNFSVSQSVSDRQSAIYEMIRQISESGRECHLKDIIAAFPGVSERTLRYDLQRMAENGSVERIGNGGPFSYYKPKNAGVPLLGAYPAGSLSG